MDKYYTPSAEEFHVGFEYEVNTNYPPSNSDKENSDNANWIKMSITKDNWHSNMDRVNLLESVRVKCLDREDIESFGWKYKDSAKREGDLFWMRDVYGVCDVMYNYETHKIVICTIEDFKDIHGGDIGVCIFCGIIKNKGELRRIMTQLQIS